MSRVDALVRDIRRGRHYLIVVTKRRRHAGPICVGAEDDAVIRVRREDVVRCACRYWGLRLRHTEIGVRLATSAERSRHRATERGYVVPHTYWGGRYIPQAPFRCGEVERLLAARRRRARAVCERAMTPEQRRQARDRARPGRPGAMRRAGAA